MPPAGTGGYYELQQQVEVLLQMGLQVIDIGEPCPVSAFRFLHLYIHPYPAVSGVLRGQGILRHDLDLSDLALPAAW